MKSRRQRLDSGAEKKGSGHNAIGVLACFMLKKEQLLTGVHNG
jgi:hypothetical protein